MLLRATDGQWYNFTLVTEGEVVTYSIDQAPSAIIGTVPYFVIRAENGLKYKLQLVLDETGFIGLQIVQSATSEVAHRRFLQSSDDNYYEVVLVLDSTLIEGEDSIVISFRLASYTLPTFLLVPKEERGERTSLVLNMKQTSARFNAKQTSAVITV